MNQNKIDIHDQVDKFFDEVIGIGQSRRAPIATERRFQQNWIEGEKEAQKQAN